MNITRRTTVPVHALGASLLAIGLGALPASADAARVQGSDGRSWSDIVRQMDAMVGATNLTAGIVVLDESGARLPCDSYALHLDEHGAAAFRIGSCDAASGQTTLDLVDRASLFEPASPVPVARTISLTATRITPRRQPTVISVRLSGACRGTVAPSVGAFAINPIDGSRVPLSPRDFRMRCNGAAMIAEADAWTFASVPTWAGHIECEVASVANPALTAEASADLACARPPTPEEIAALGAAERREQAQRREDERQHEIEVSRRAEEEHRRERHERRRLERQRRDLARYRERLATRPFLALAGGALGGGIGALLGLGVGALGLALTGANANCFANWRSYCTDALAIGAGVGMAIGIPLVPMLPSNRARRDSTIAMAVTSALGSAGISAVAIAMNRPVFALAGAVGVPVIASIAGALADGNGVESPPVAARWLPAFVPVIADGRVTGATFVISGRAF